MTDAASEPAPRMLSRRHFMGGATALSILAAAGVNLANASPAFAATPGTTADSVIAYAKLYEGLTLAGVKNPLTSPEVPSGAWNVPPYNKPWCAWFASWCLRELGLGTIIDAGGFRGLPEHANPEIGDVVEYQNGKHVGIVTQVVGGIRTIEGNRGQAGYTGNTVKPGGLISDYPIRRYFRPPYLTTTPEDPNRSGGADMLMIMKGAGPIFNFALFAPGFWYEWSAPGDGSANAFAVQISGGATGAVVVTATEWNAIKAEAQRPIEVIVTT